MTCLSNSWSIPLKLSRWPFLLHLCSSAAVTAAMQGPVNADGILDMAQAFLLANALQDIITTLWWVPDESAAIFAKFFYQYLIDGYPAFHSLLKVILNMHSFSKYTGFIHWEWSPADQEGSTSAGVQGRGEAGSKAPSGLWDVYVPPAGHSGPKKCRSAQKMDTPIVDSTYNNKITCKRQTWFILHAFGKKCAIFH